MPKTRQELINACFDQDFHNWRDVNEVVVKGKKLKPYNLTLFRSITLKNASDKAIEIEERLLKDAENAVEMKSASWGKRLYFASKYIGHTKQCHEQPKPQTRCEI